MRDGSSRAIDLLGGLGDQAREPSVSGFAAIWRGEPLPIGDRGEVVAALAARGCCEIDGDTVVGIHGLTLRSTRHRFVHAGIALGTWCAFDSIGIPAALGLTATAETTCGGCGAPITVELRDGAPIGDASLVLWLPDAGGDHLMNTFCSAADLYCSRAHLEQQLGPDAAGAVVDLGAAAALGREVWADVADVEKWYAPRRRSQSDRRARTAIDVASRRSRRDEPSGSEKKKSG